MPVHKKKKYTKYRGSHTHGGGSKKKRRGAGNRGGVGNAGTGKRGNANTPTILKKFGNLTNYFGKHGFKLPREVKIVQYPINIKEVEQRLSTWIVQNKIKNDKKLVINLPKLGYNKLLSEGKVKNKYTIIVPYFSKKAEDKINAAGGEIITDIKPTKEEK